jgi:hypothetical protein
MFDPQRGYPGVVPFRALPLIDPATDRPWGVRQAIVADPGGHIWELSQHLHDVPLSAWGAEPVSELPG